MAESTTTPDYSLDAATLRAVSGASVGGDAMDAYIKSTQVGNVGSAVTAGAEAFYQARADKEARNEAAAQVKISAAAKWDEAFDAMGERGAWASPELHDQFMQMEEKYKKDYLEAVRTGDKKEQSRILKEQGARSNSLQSWKSTMETAAEINKEYGWGEILNGDDEEAIANRGILEAIAKNDGTAIAVVDADTGEIGFTVGEVITDPETGERIPQGRVWTRREIDEMVATGTAPVVRQESFMTTSIEQQNLGIQGKPFQKQAQHYSNLKGIKKELRTNPKATTSILRDVWAGETSLEADLREAIATPGAGIQFSVTLPEGSTLDQNNDGVLTEADLSADSVDVIISALEADPDLLSEVAADWMTMKQEISHSGGLEEYNKNKSLTMFSNMTKEQKNALTSDQLLKLLMGQR
tara:strand:- start:3281 stop:4513 length:1233 start_codon:yes stop_codon:yes gene_type:complete